LVLRPLALAAMLSLAGCGAEGQVAGPAEASVLTGFFPSGDIQLSYQLEKPAGRGPFPAVVVGHGSGETTKQACRFLVQRFLQRGYAVLCYDKRGVGQSTGTYVNVGTRNSEERFPILAADMAAGARFLRTERDIDGKRIGLVGNSQAGWIIPLAAREAKPAFMIILVGPTVSVGEEMYYSEFAEKTTTPLEKLAGILTKFTGPHGFDPRPVLSTLDVPGLWLLGGEDRSIPTPETVAILDDLIRKGRPFARVVYASSGHDLTRTADIWPDVDRWLPTLGR
jgi:uncharacterized protein